MNKARTRSWLQIAAVLILLILLYGIIKQADITVEQILSWTPADPVLAAIVLLLLYALKSVTIFVPLVVLEIAVGMVFPVEISLPLNLLGSLIDLTVPYWIGYCGGRKRVERILEKYPKTAALRIGHRHPVFESFLLRII